MAQSVPPSGNIPLPPPSGSNANANANSDGTAKVKLTNTGRTTLLQSVYFIVYILMRPVTLPFSIAGYMIRQTRNITLVVLGEMAKVSGLVFNVVELGVLVLKSLNVIVFRDGNTKPLMPRMMDVYNRMADTLTDIHALPSTKESGALGHLMLSRLPGSIWDKLLPYPHPFFRGSVTQATKSDSNKLITSMRAIPNDQYSPSPPEKKTK